MSTGVFSKTAPGARVFRPGAPRFFGWAWIVFSAANFVDLIWRGRDMTSVVAGTVLLLGCGIAYAVGLRPRIVADDGAVRLHNVLRDVHVPWTSVDRIEGGDAVYVHAGGRRYRAYVLQMSPRNRARFETKARREDRKLPDAVAEHVRGRTPTDFAVEQLQDMAERTRTSDADEGTPRRKGSPAPGPSVRWALPAVSALAVPAVAFATAMVAALF